MHDPDARARIYENYAKLHPPPEEVIDDYDDPRALMDADELKQHYAEKLAAESTGTFPDRMKAKREEIYARSAPEPEEADSYDDRPGVHQAVEAFWERHSDISESDWKKMTSPEFLLTAPDLAPLKAKAEASGSRADYERFLERIPEVYETAKEQRERAEVVRQMMRGRSPLDENALDAKIKKTMKEAR